MFALSMVNIFYFILMLMLACSPTVVGMRFGEDDLTKCWAADAQECYFTLSFSFFIARLHHIFATSLCKACSCKPFMLIRWRLV
jgi:hypothetical protein